MEWKLHHAHGTQRGRRLAGSMTELSYRAHAPWVKPRAALGFRKIFASRCVFLSESASLYKR